MSTACVEMSLNTSEKIAYSFLSVAGLSYFCKMINTMFIIIFGGHRHGKIYHGKR